MINEDESKQATKGLRRNGHKLAGILFTTVGVFWFSHKVGWISSHEGGPAIFWPLVTIGVGLFILFGSRHKDTQNSK